MSSTAPWQTKTVTRQTGVEFDKIATPEFVRQIVHLDPVSKPRQTQRDKWNPSKAVQRYRLFADLLRSTEAFVPESHYHITFIIAMPKSWPKKKRAEMDGQPHQQKPDKDNLEKAVLDAIHKEDSHVWDGRVTKRWGETGKIIIDYEVQ